MYTPVPTRKPRTWLRLVAIVVIGIIVAGVVTVWNRDLLPEPELPDVPGPSVAQLDQAIRMAEQYLDGLYKPLGDKDAVQSEHYGLPVRAYFPLSRTWALLGEDETSSISALPDKGLGEEYSVSLRGGDITVEASVVWQKDSQNFTLTATPKTVREKAELWVGHTLLGTLESNSTKVLTSPQLTAADYSTLASLRYTVRHATQQALMYWQIRGNKEKTGRLEDFLSSNGYQPGFDMRAILFNRSAKLPDDLATNREAYKDCDHLPRRQSSAYPYKSKACQVLGAYFSAAERDPFLQATFALHMLQKYGSATRGYTISGIAATWMQGDTPLETAKHLRQQWGRTGVGIPSCTPAECQNVASGIRTFVYGTLETELGYNTFSDPVARLFADAAATQTVIAQVFDGKVRMTGGEAYRPVFTGAVLSYWDNQGRFAPPSPSLLGSAIGSVVDSAGMPPEYTGVLPSNSETTFDAWVFLVRYRCLKYAVGCYPAS